ncbi:MAG: type III-A CRISPR-associated protein Cas10/Csm1 [Thermodesulfovibrionales bacterium]
MSETVYKIAIAAFLHDIGKFAERSIAKVEVDRKGFFASEYFLNNNRDLYQPFYNGRYTHSHSIYTAAFIDHFESLLPEEFNKSNWGIGDSFVNLAAGHHKPETPMQWIIAIADRVSSGFDRAEFEEKYNKEIDVRDYKKTRLLTIFEGLSPDGQWRGTSLDDYKYRYPLKELSPENIFPVSSDEVKDLESKEASEEYRQLFSKFVENLEGLGHKKNIHLWFEHFDSLCMIFISHIPAATVGNVVPDVSLYDHSRTTSALASALYQYHKENNVMTIESVKDYETKKFLIITADFYGIQDFIFTEGGSTGTASAKLLRGRSFYISLLSELAADMLCRELNLPVTSIILNAAGKFTILAHNTLKSKERAREVEDRINDWLLKNFFGQASMGFSMIEASCNDFVRGRFSELWDKLSSSVDRKKYTKFNLLAEGGCVKDYLDSFDNQLGICPFCNKRSAVRSAKLKDEYACKICHDHIFIGTRLVKERQIAITSTDAVIYGEKLLEPIFGVYQLAFVTGELIEMARQDKIFKFWDIGISETGEISKKLTAKFINGYVPKYEEEDLNDERYLAGRKSQKRKLEMIEQIRVNKEEFVPKTFAHIAVKALNPIGTGKFMGIEALGILKADVDNLGLLFACGMKKELFTLSRLATMSRQLNNYFSIYLPYILKTEEKFKNIYTVFAGGDDLFLIGPWNRIIDFAYLLNDSFREYVCGNKAITLSAGIALHKPNTPVLTISEASEKAIHTAKSKGRNRITIFRETVTWDDFIELKEIKEKLIDWLDSEKINNAMLFRLNEFIEMRRQEEIVKVNDFINLEDMECIKWRARLKYSIVRNIGKHLKAEEKLKAIEDIMEMVRWLEDYGGALRIPLWQVIYNRRK